MSSGDVQTSFNPLEDFLPEGFEPVSTNSEDFAPSDDLATFAPTPSPDAAFSTTTTAILAQIVNASAFGENVNGSQRIDLQVTIWGQSYETF